MRLNSLKLLLLIPILTLSGFDSKAADTKMTISSPSHTIASGDLRTKLIAALDDILGIGNNDTQRGQMLTNWHVLAVDWFRALGMSEVDIVTRVESRLNLFFQRGRAQGLSQKVTNCTLLLAEGVGSTIVLPGFSNGAGDGTFLGKYDLEPYRELRRKLGTFDSFKIDSGYYAISLEDAYKMAAKVGSYGFATEALLHILRLGKYENAYKIAESNQDDQALMTIGFLTLVDFFEGPHRHFYNYLWSAIESFKRIQGPLKRQAEMVMYDLASEVTSDAFLDQIQPDSRQIYLEHGLRLLRATGRLVNRVPIDSIKVNFITKITDLKVIHAIRVLIPRLNSSASQEIRDALAAISDFEALVKEADELFSKRATAPFGSIDRNYRRALKLYETAENIDGMKMVFNAVFTETLTNFSSYSIHEMIGPFLVAYGPAELPRVLEFIDLQASKATEQGGREEYEDLKELLTATMARGDYTRFLEHRRGSNIELSVPAPVLAPGLQDLLNRQKHLHALIETAITVATPARINEFKNQAAFHLAEGNGFAAYQASLEALDYHGLVAAGDLMVRQKDGLNALNAYLAASVLIEFNGTY